MTVQVRVLACPQKKKKMKTYILKYDVYNFITFPKGTVVKITDDYWGGGSSDQKNTGFTVTKGKLKGQKGNVADGLNGWLLENTVENRKLLSEFKSKEKSLNISINSLNRAWNKIKAVVL